jgi:hypothetical protein
MHVFQQADVKIDKATPAAVDSDSSGEMARPLPFPI